MLFRRTESRRMNPYVALTIGTLAMIGAFSVVKCSKRTVRCVCDKMTSVFSGKDTEKCTVCE
jgi:hypothetical protein